MFPPPLRSALNFYPRSPCGERPLPPPCRRSDIRISIHALLAESDYRHDKKSRRYYHFYPRSPCGERPDMSDVIMQYNHEDFYPRSPCGERRFRQEPRVKLVVISIHALLAESDSKSAQNSGALLRIWNKFYGDCIFMLTGKAVFYPFCPCFFHIFWCEGTGNFMIAFPSH